MADEKIEIPNGVSEAQWKSLITNHEIWLQQPHTQVVFKALSNLQDRTVAMMISDLDPNKPFIAHQHGVMLKSISEIVTMLSTPTIFAERATKRKS